MLHLPVLEMNHPLIINSQIKVRGLAERDQKRAMMDLIDTKMKEVFHIFVQLLAAHIWMQNSGFWIGDSNEWRTANEDEWDEEEEDEDDDEEIPHCLRIEKPPPNWRIVPEVINRQIGSNPLFQRRFYGSLHAVERLELMYNLNEHQVYYLLFHKHYIDLPILILCKNLVKKLDYFCIVIYIDIQLLFTGLRKCFKLQ